MKAIFKLFLCGSVVIAACGQSSHNNEMASDTASVFDTTRLNTPADTSAVYNVQASGQSQTVLPSQYEESNGKQSSRVSVGSDTTGKRPHDGYPTRTTTSAGKSDTAGHSSTPGRGVPVRPRH